MSTTPKTVNELVAELVRLEKENAQLKRKVTFYSEKLTQMKGVAVALLTRAGKQNTFTNVQVKGWGEQILGILNSEKRPTDLRR